MNDKLTWKSKLSFGIGAFGKDLVYAIVSTFILKYLVDIRLVDSVYVAVLFAVARLWDAVNDTFMGAVVDNTKSRWGKFRPWILIGTVVNAVILVLLYLNVSMSPILYAVYIGIMYILWGMTYTIMDIPYWSMVPALTNNESERRQISAIPRFFASFAWLVIGTFGLYIVKYLGNGNDVNGYAIFATIVAVIFIICTLITVFNVKERNVAVSTGVSGKVEKISIKKIINVLAKNDQVIVVLLIALCFNLAYQLSTSFALFYFEYVCGVKEDLFSLYSLVAGITQMAALFLYPIISTKINKKILFVISCVFSIIGFMMLLTFGYVAPTSMALVGVSAAVVNIGIGFMLAIITVVLSEVVDYGEFKLHTRNESIIFSTQTFVVKLAGAFSALVSGVGLKAIGYVANAEQSEGTKMGMRIIMLVIPAILLAITIVIYLLKYKLNDKYYREIMQELEVRRNDNIAESERAGEDVAPSENIG